jgi:tRNA(adenine34) deaminase
MKPKAMFNNFSDILLKLAKKAAKNGEIPIACIAVLDGNIIAKAYNLVEKRKNKMAHAEMIVLEKLRKKFNTTHFFGMKISLYITLEPCCMCISAISMCGIENVFYMLEDKKIGGIERIYTENSSYFKPNLFLVEAPQYEKLLIDFFKNLR